MRHPGRLVSKRKDFTREDKKCRQKTNSVRPCWPRARLRHLILISWQVTGSLQNEEINYLIYIFKVWLCPLSAEWIIWMQVLNLWVLLGSYFHSPDDTGWGLELGCSNKRGEKWWTGLKYFLELEWIGLLMSLLWSLRKNTDRSGLSVVSLKHHSPSRPPKTWVQSQSDIWALGQPNFLTS